MSLPFSTIVTSASLIKRRVAVEACIVASLASPNGSKLSTEYEIGKFVRDRHGFEWTNRAAIARVLLHMLATGRIDSHRPDDRTFPLYSLPADPEQSAKVREKRSAESAKVREKRSAEFDRTIFDRMELPKFFRIPGREDLLPSTKTRTGYDVRTDYNRF